MSRKPIPTRIKCKLLDRDNYTCRICSFHKVYTINDVPKMYMRDFKIFSIFYLGIANNVQFKILRFIDPGGDIEDIIFEWLSPARLELDHIVPVCHGGSDDESNLRYICDECHQDKTHKDLHPSVNQAGWK